MTYNPFPLGQIPKHLQRTELEDIKKLGYEWNDPRDVIDIFEKAIAEYCGAPYFVVTDSCTHAIELSLRYLIHNGQCGNEIMIPEHTYISVAMVIEKCGLGVKFYNQEWVGIYQLLDTDVIDSATRFTKGCYMDGFLQCLSFQQKKRLPIGRGGGILCSTKEQYDWLKWSSYDGRDLTLPYDHPDHIKCMGYHYYMTPEDCARGLILFEELKDKAWEDTGNWTMYPNVKQMLKR